MKKVTCNHNWDCNNHSMRNHIDIIGNHLVDLLKCPLVVAVDARKKISRGSGSSIHIFSSPFLVLKFNNYTLKLVLLKTFF